MRKARTTIIAALLLCLASGPVFGRNPAVDTLRILGPKRVFITSEVFNGNLGGVEGADQKCQDLADAAGLQGTFMAWISVGGADPDTDSPGKRFATFSVGPYILTNGATVAGDWGDLTDGSINVFLGRDENGGIPVGGGAWTATSVSGTHQGFDCMDWTSASDTDFGLAGDLGDTDAQWTEDSNSPCNIQRHLYCFEQ